MTLRTGTTLMALACALALAGCGGGAEEPAPPAAAIDRAAADDLALRADEIADAYAGGDVCGAAQLADELKAEAEQAVASGAVPRARQAELEAVVNDLVNRINCPPPTEEEDEGDEEKKGKGKGKGKNGGDEEESVETVSTEEAQ
jgi:hypothetical protein